MSTETNGYIAFYAGKQIEVHSTTSANAQIAAFNRLRDMFPRRKIKAWEITVMLAERGTAGGTRTGEQVVHSTAGLG